MHFSIWMKLQKYVWHAFSNKIKRDMIEGDAESRTELTTYGLTQIATINIRR